MSEPFFEPHVAIPVDDEPDQSTLLFDPTQVEERERWEARAAQWRARALAELVFGGEVAAALAGQGQRGPFRGILDLSVPFEDLVRHRELEQVFLSAARRDPLLARVPFLFVFTAAPALRAR
jgi:hypothetical protein